MSFKKVYDEWAEDYDLMYRNPDGGMEEVDRLCARVLPDLPAGADILEIGCGTGQVAAALARAGHKVTAIEFSARKIEVARARAERLGLDIEFLHGDFLEYEDVRKFDLAFALSSFITHFLEEAAQMQCVQRIRKCLKPDGCAVIGIYDYGTLMRREPDVAITPVAPITRENGTKMYFQRRTWAGAPRSPIHKCCYFVVPETSGEPVKVFSMQRRAITPANLSRALRQFGFEESRWFSPDEADHYQSICLGYANARDNPQQVGASEAQISARRTYLVWAGSTVHKTAIESILQSADSVVGIHYTQLIDRSDEIEYISSRISTVTAWIEELQERFGQFEFSISGVNRTEFSHQCRPSLVQAYLAAQVMMSAHLSRTDRIVMYLSETSVDEAACREMIRCISRTEEIPCIDFIAIPKGSKELSGKLMIDRSQDFDNSSPQNHIREIYDDWASSYHFLYPNPEWAICEAQETYGAIIEKRVLGKDILYVGCSVGLGALGLAKLGFNVTGIDYSAQSIELAKARFASHSLDATFSCVDVLEWQSPQLFDAVVAVSSFLDHFASADQQRMIVEKLWQSVKVGGILILGMHDYEYLMEHEPNDAAYPPTIVQTESKGPLLYFRRRKWRGKPRERLHRSSFYFVNAKDELHTVGWDVFALFLEEVAVWLTELGADFEIIESQASGYYQTLIVAARAQ